MVIKATHEHAQLIEKLALTIWHEHYTPLIGEEQVEYMLKNFQNAEVIKQQIISQEYEYFIAFAKNNSTQLAVGYCSVKWGAKEQSIFLSKLYISAQYRKMGFSKKLLNTVFSKYPIYKYI